MGKVQDTINRIASRRRHHDAQAIALIIPTQKKPGPQSFPTSSDAIATWLVANTSAPYHTQLSGLTRALQHSNRLTNTATERLKIVTLFKTRIDAMMPLLTQPVINSKHPYNNEAAQSYEGVKTLLRELAYGYKSALIDVLLRRSGLHRLDRIHSTYFAMRYLTELGLRHSQACERWPEKCWRDINTLYWLAEKENATHETVATAAAGSDGYPATIAGLYNAISLFHLSRQSLLRASDMEQLMLELSSHANRTDLQSTPPVTSLSTLYSVSLNSDRAPAQHRYCNYGFADKIRYIDVAQVCEAILDYRPAGTPGLSDAQRRAIVQTLQNKRQRQYARVIASTAVSVQSGLKESHAMLQQPLSKPATSSARWTLLNHSKCGLCLRSNNPGEHQFQVGDLMTCHLHNANGETMHTGIIRWIKVVSPNEIQTGIELLGKKPKPVHCEK